MKSDDPNEVFHSSAFQNREKTGKFKNGISYYKGELRVRPDKTDRLRAMSERAMDEALIIYKGALRRLADR